MDHHNKQITALLVQAGLVPHLVGLPGIGKTAFIRQLAEKLGYHCHVVLTSNNEPSQILGVLYPENGSESFRKIPPTWALKASREPNHLIFFDEISNAPGVMQAALLTAIQDKIVAELPLHPLTRFVTAMNPPEISPMGRDLSAPLANRLCHIDWHLDEPAFLRYLEQNYIRQEDTDEFDPLILPEDWERHLKWAASLVRDFLSIKKNLVHTMPTSPREQAKPWASPRSWAHLVHALAACRAVDIDPIARRRIIVGFIGFGAGNEFENYLMDEDLPSPQALLQNPKLLPADKTRPDRVLACVISVANYFLDTPKTKRAPVWEPIQAFFIHVANSGFKDAAASKVVEVLRAGMAAALVPDPAFIKTFHAILINAKVLA